MLGAGILSLASWFPCAISEELASPPSPSPAPDLVTESSPADGKLGLKELIQLRIDSDPDIAKLIGDVQREKARRLGITDLPDPEFRISFDWESDVELDRPYTRRIVEERRTSGSGSDFDRTDSGGNRVDTTDSDKTSGNRRRETIEKITPGPNKTTIEREFREYESESRDRKRTETETKPGQSIPPRTESERSRSESRSKLVGREREVRYNSFDPLAPSRGVRGRIRWDIPHIPEMRARLAAAIYEIGYAEARLRAETRRVAMRVRKSYEELEYLKMRFYLERDLYEAEKRYEEAQEALVKDRDETIDELAQRFNAITRQYGEMLETKDEYESAKLELAAFVGLDDHSRIHVSESILQRDFSPNDQTARYLTDLALANHYQIDLTERRLQLAEGDYRVYRAKRIPFASFFDLDWARDYQDGTKDNDAWGVQLGFSVPFFSLLQHRGHKEHEEEIALYKAVLLRHQKQITAEVWARVRDLGEASRELRALEARLGEIRVEADQHISANTGEKADPARAADAMANVIEARLHAKHLLIRAIWSYNQRIFALEDAIGTDLSTALERK
jgi:hypothetical protein